MSNPNDYPFAINHNPYPFINFEGIDGCGKSSVLKTLKEYFDGKAVAVHVAKEPTDLEYGQKFRAILANHGRDECGVPVSPEDLQRLCILDRLHHNSALEVFLKTMAVVEDRYWESTLAYLMAFGGSPVFVLEEHARIFGEAGKQLILPDLTIILDITAEEALERQQAMGKGLDYYEDELLKRKNLREAYLDVPVILRRLLPHLPIRIKIIDGMRPKEEVFADVLSTIEQAFAAKVASSNVLRSSRT